MPGSMKFFKKKKAVAGGKVVSYSGAGARDLKAFSGSGYRYLEIEFTKIASRIQVVLISNYSLPAYGNAFAGYYVDGANAFSAGTSSGGGPINMTFSTGDTMMVAVRQYNDNRGDLCLGKNGVWYSGGTDGLVVMSSYLSAWSSSAFLRVYGTSALDAYTVAYDSLSWKYGNLKPASAVAYPY